MTLEPKYFTAACTEIKELLNFLDQLLIAKRIIDRGLEGGGNSETSQNSTAAQNLNLLEIARVRRMYSTSNNLTSASICDVLLGILYSRLGNFHIASQMFHKSTIDIAELQSSHSKIPPLQMVSRLINMGFASLLHVFTLKDPQIEEINRLKTHFYDLEQRVRGVPLLSHYLNLLKILLEIEADELGRAQDHLRRFWQKLAELLGYKGAEQAQEHQENQLQLTNNPLSILSTKLQLVRSPYLIKQLFYYATGRLLMKEYKKKNSRVFKVKKAIRALKYYLTSFNHTPILCPFFTRRALKDAKQTAGYLSRLLRDTPPWLIDVQRFIGSIHRRVQGNRRLRFKFLVQIQDPLSSDGVPQRRSRVKAILTRLIKLLSSHSNVSLILFWAGNYACKFQDLQLEKYRDNILLAIEELFKPLSPENLPRQEFYLRSNAERGTQTILDISRNRSSVRDLEKAFLGSLLKSYNSHESDPDQWLVLLVSGSHLGGINLVRYQTNYDRYEAYAQKTSLWLIDLDPLYDPIQKDVIDSDPIKYLTTPHLSKLASYIAQEDPTDGEIEFAYSAAVASFHSDPFPMIGEKF